jgi:hypothetical protein
MDDLVVAREDDYHLYAKCPGCKSRVEIRRV